MAHTGIRSKLRKLEAEPTLARRSTAAAAGWFAPQRRFGGIEKSFHWSHSQALGGFGVDVAQARSLGGGLGADGYLRDLRVLECGEEDAGGPRRQDQEIRNLATDKHR